MADRHSNSLDSLNAEHLRSVVTAFRDALRTHQDDLNRLNVYPVPDGDTGTNMALTLESVVKGLDSAESMPEVCEAIARGSLMGARGNSGVITSQILRGLTTTFSSLAEIGAQAFATGLREAADAAYQAVLRPVEGTILTVVREAADAVDEAASTQALSSLLMLAVDAARASVARTPDLLPVLADAGVVDAGGKGFTLLLDAFVFVATGRPMPEPDVVATPTAVAAHLRGDDVSSLRYEVMFLLDARDETVPAFKDAWGALGDSIVVVGGDGIWNCHVHTNDIGGAVEAGVQAGRPHEIRVTDLFEEVEEREEWVREHLDDVVDGHDPVTTAVVAVGVGDGVSRLLTSLGVQSVVAGGQSMNPSTEQILEAVERTRADAVIVLPNNKNIVPVAQQVDGLSERPVHVVPTKSVVEALGALVEYDPASDAQRNVETMTDAAQRIRTGEVTQAVRPANADVGRIEQGDWIAIARDGICAATKSAVDAAIMLVDQLVDGDSEIVTILVGSDADPHDRSRIADHVGLAHPQVEVEFHDGDQPLYPYLVGVE